MAPAFAVLFLCRSDRLRGATMRRNVYRVVVETYAAAVGASAVARSIRSK